MGVVAGAPRSRIGDGIADRRERDQPDLTTRRMGADFARELVAVHHRHAEIAKDEVGAPLRDEALHPFLTVRGDSNLRAERGQHVPSKLTVIAIILDDEHG